MFTDLRVRYWLSVERAEPGSKGICKLPLIGRGYAGLVWKQKRKAWDRLTALIPQSERAASGVLKLFLSEKPASTGPACKALCSAANSGWDSRPTIRPDLVRDLLVTDRFKSAKYHRREFFEAILPRNPPCREMLISCLRDGEQCVQIAWAFPLHSLPAFGVPVDACLAATELLFHTISARHGGWSRNGSGAMIQETLRSFAGRAKAAEVRTLIRRMLCDGPDAAGPDLVLVLFPLVSEFFKEPVSATEETYRELLHSKAGAVRTSALNALLKLRGASALSAEILNASRDSDEQMLRTAVFGMKSLLDEPRILQRIWESFEQGDRFDTVGGMVRHLAAESQQQFDRLCGYLEGSDHPDLVRRASTHLPETRNRRVPLATLLRCLSSESIEGTIATAELAKWHPSDLRPFVGELVALLEKCKSDLFWLFGGVLEAMRPEELLPFVPHLLKTAYGSERALRMLEAVPRNELSPFVPELLRLVRLWRRVADSSRVIRILATIPNASNDERIAQAFLDFLMRNEPGTPVEVVAFASTLDDALIRPRFITLLETRSLLLLDEPSACLVVEKVAPIGQAAIEPLLRYGSHRFSGLAFCDAPRSPILDQLNKALLNLMDEPDVLRRAATPTNDFFLLQFFFQFATHKCTDPMTRARLVAASRLAGCDVSTRSRGFLTTSVAEAMLYMEAVLRDLEYLTEKEFKAMRGIWDSDGGSGMGGYWGATAGTLEEITARAKGWLEQVFADPAITGVVVAQTTGDAACASLSRRRTSAGEQPLDPRIACSGSGYHWIDTWIPSADASTLPEPDRDYSALTR